jgi:ribosomal protein L11 methyltransferase
MSSWYKVDITIVDEAVEPLSGGLIELSPSGVQIETLEEHGDMSVLTVYQSADVLLDDLRLSIAELLDRISASGFNTSSSSVSITSITDKDWTENYKQFFSTIRIGRVLVKPSWENIGFFPGDIVVRLDPGLAFGTGSHSTTEGCIYSLQHVIEGGETVYDIGTGSGVLAIVAAKLGANRVIAIDNDPVAIGVARENALDNGVEERIEFHIADIAEFGGVSADIVVANLTAPAIVSILPLIVENVDGFKKFIASGITDEQKDGVVFALEEHGFSVEKSFEKNKWATLVAGRG